MAFVVQKADTVFDNLLEIAEFIARDNPSRAYTFIEELKNYFDSQLSAFPESGRKLERKEVRQLSYKGYTAFYEVDKENEIVYILYIVNLEKPLEVRGIDF